MRIAVIDDEKYSRIEIIHQLHTEIGKDHEILEASSGAEAARLLEGEPFDLLFVDIDLGDMEGTTIAALARRLMPDAKIIFVTAFSDYAVRAFDLHANDYILKPVDPKRFKEALEHCLKENRAVGADLPSDPELERIGISSNRLTTLIDIENISYVETDGNGRGCIIHTRTGESYSDATSLSDYETKLESHGFFRTHKTCLVRLDCIKDIFTWKNGGFGLRLRDDVTELPISRSRIKELRKKLSI